MRRGVLYAVSDPMWAKETFVSALSCKRTMPDLERELYATSDITGAMDANSRANFTNVVTIENPKFIIRPRFEAYLQTGLDQVLYVDSDTYFVEPVYELFDLLDHYDLGLVRALQHIHQRFKELKLDKVLPSVSTAVSEFNGGVIVYRNNERTRAGMKEWMRLFAICMDHNYEMDQAALRVMIANSDLRVAAIPDNYNFRANMLQCVQGKVKILHAHGELKTLARTINLRTNRRLYEPDPTLIYGYQPKNFSLVKAKKNLLRGQG